MFNCIDDAAMRRRIQTAAGAYLFFGDEDFTKNRLAADLRRAVVGEGEETAADCVRFDTLGFDADMIATEVAAVSFAGRRRFVEVRDPPLTTARNDKFAAQTDLFIDLLSRMGAYSDTVLLIVVSRGALDFGDVAADRPSALYKRIAEFAQPVRFDFPSQPKLRSWISRHFDMDGLTVTTDAVDVLLALCGSSMYALSGEIEKLTARVKSRGDTVVTAEDVSDSVAGSTEDKDFALVNALTDGNRAAVFEAMRKMKLRRDEPIAACGAISRVCRNAYAVAEMRRKGMPISDVAAALGMSERQASFYARAYGKSSPEKLKTAVKACLDADMQLKSTRLDYIALERLVCAIIGADA